MPVAVGRDVAATEERLAQFLAATTPEREQVVVRILPAPGGTGFSSESLLFDAEWVERGERRSVGCVARIRPTGYSLYQEHDLESQWRVIDALARHTAVPVPRIIAQEATGTTWLGQPFFVMERIDGVAAADSPPYTVKGWLKELTPDQQRHVYRRGIEVLAEIHRTDWQRLGLGFLSDSTINPVGIDGQLAHDEQFARWVVKDRSFPLFESASGPWLAAHAPDDGELALSWGDARLGNMLFRDTEPVAVLDWEMVTLSTPAADLGWYLTFNQIHTIGIDRPGLPGIPVDAEAVAIYERAAGHEVTDLHFFMVRAAYRAALLLVRFTDELAARGTALSPSGKTPATPAMVVLERLLGA